MLLIDICIISRLSLIDFAGSTEIRSHMNGVKKNSLMRNLNKDGKKFVVMVLMLTLAVGLISGCSSSKKKSSVVSGSSILPIANRTTASTEKTNSNEIKMTGILTYINTSDLIMYFADVESGDEYKVNYTGGTDIQNKYKSVISASRMILGDIYDIKCNKSGKALSIYESSTFWENSGVTDLSVNEPTRSMTIGATSYSYTDDTVVLSAGNKISATEIMDEDVVTVRGNSKTVYSVTVDKGHGYISFTGCSAFLGGYVDIGTKMILTVSEGMIVTAPEGTYKVTMQLGDLQGSKTVVVSRNKDIAVDFSEFKVAAVQMGAVLFSLTPSSAVMYIDGTQVDYSQELQLAYGSHKVVLKANNYTTYTETFIVKQAYEKKIIDMATSSTSSTKSSTTSTTATDLTSGYVVNVKAPTGAAIYVDSVYIGIAPVSFNKSSGNKVITMTQVGFATKSYTIAIANATGDLNYSFPDMESETQTGTSAN